MLSVSEIVAKTEAMFDLFNHHFYNDELTRPAITVSPDGGRGAYGWCSVYVIWQASGEAYREISISWPFHHRNPALLDFSILPYYICLPHRTPCAISGQ